MPEVRNRRPGLATIGLALLLAALAAAVLVRPGEPGPLQLANPDLERAEAVQRFLDEGVPRPAMILVGMDPDLGTYPEIRPATRAAFDDLLGSNVRLAFISFTPEGRAIAAAEMQRLRDAGSPSGAILDLGYVTGSEAGIVRSVTDIVPADATGAFADALRGAGGGMSAFGAALVIGGSDLTARTWVEQVGSRLPQLPLVAVAPTFALPELEPYLATGQLTGMLATTRDDAAFVSLVGTGDVQPGTAAPEPAPSAAAILLGMLLALAVLLVTLAGPRRDRAAAEPRS